MHKIELGLTLLSLIIWLFLLTWRGQFWRTDQILEVPSPPPLPGVKTPGYFPLPSVCAVIPARNEADLLPITLRSLLTQDYPGAFTVFLVDDHSTDGTTEVAIATALELGKEKQLQVIAAETLPPGWTGKLWAMEQGIQKAQTLAPDYLLLTDADIQHDVANLSRLVDKAQQENLDLASVMVRLRCESFWEQLLIPAFVFFFQKLYPFRWVNDPRNSTAAAAGGCILVRRDALTKIGGIQVVRQALIDDCALAKAVKWQNSLGFQPQEGDGGNIWLGLSGLTCSLRPYPSLETIWGMVARTAFTQLNYSPLLLLGTLLGMLIIYVLPPLATVVGVLTGYWSLAVAGFGGWLLMTLAYFPTIRFYQCSPLFAFCLPAIGFLYTLMTLDSALRYWQGRGGAWKGRVYPTG